VFELVEAAFDPIAVFVEVGVVRDRDLARWDRWDEGEHAGIGDELAKMVAVVGFVSNDGAAVDALEQCRCGDDVVDLSAGENEAQRPTKCIGKANLKPLVLAEGAGLADEALQGALGQGAGDPPATSNRGPQENRAGGHCWVVVANGPSSRPPRCRTRTPGRARAPRPPAGSTRVVWLGNQNDSSGLSQIPTPLVQLRLRRRDEGGMERASYESVSCEQSYTDADSRSAQIYKYRAFQVPRLKSARGP
jgi:hypothetical protein